MAWVEGSMKVVFFSPEVVPFATTGGLGDVCGALPLALEKLGIDITIFMPYYRVVNRFQKTLRRIEEEAFNTTIGQNVQVYFIKNDAFFDREGIYGNNLGEYPDNLERFEFFCARSLELLKKLNLQVDVLHCHDWQTCLIPAYLKFLYGDDPFFKDVKSVLTIHNMAYQGVFAKEEFSKLKLGENFFTLEGFEFYHHLNLLKGGIIFSDMVTTVSQTYACEIQRPPLDCGLEGVLLKRKNPVVGILNGLDYDRWNPSTDSSITKTYSSQNIEDKVLNKKQLQQDLNLPQESDVPLFGFVGRLSHQKGLDLLFKAMPELMKLDLQIVFLGIGEEKYHQFLEEAVRKYPQKLAALLEFDEAMAHRIYAGCDLFLMPSLYEPCGLSQMISLRYGTIPLVHKTGGLTDTIVDFDSENGNGFVFEEYSEAQLIGTIQKALKIFHNRPLFSKLVKKSMTYDFSWEKSAGEYKKVYESLKEPNLQRRE